MRIEVGRFYSDREGHRSGPVFRLPADRVFGPFIFGAIDRFGEIETYTAEGRVWSDPAVDLPGDLIVEWVDFPRLATANVLAFPQFRG